MKKLIVSLLLITAFIGLFSCEGNTTRVWKIENNSTKIVRVKSDIFGNYINSSDTIFIGIDQTETIGTTDQLGGQSMPGSPTQSINSLFIINSDGDSLTIDYNVESNWKVHSEHRKKVPSDYLHEFTLEVSDSDFQ